MKPDIFLDFMLEQLKDIAQKFDEGDLKGDVKEFSFKSYPNDYWFVSIKTNNGFDKSQTKISKDKIKGKKKIIKEAKD